MTAQEKYDKKRKWLEKVAKEHPELQWPKEELRFMTVDDFEKPEYRRRLTMDMGSVGVCDRAVACEIAYNGT